MLCMLMLMPCAGIPLPADGPILDLNPDYIEQKICTEPVRAAPVEPHVNVPAVKVKIFRHLYHHVCPCSLHIWTAAILF